MPQFNKFKPQYSDFNETTTLELNIQDYVKAVSDNVDRLLLRELIIAEVEQPHSPLRSVIKDIIREVLSE